MLSDAIRQQARLAIQSRFQLRDEVLVKELDQLSSKRVDADDDDAVSKLNIRLRLLCEHDLFERAFIVWNNLRKAHEECGGSRSNELLSDFIKEARQYMEEATINLAGHLKRSSDVLAPAFAGRSAITAEWLAKLRRYALEKQSKDMEDYIQGLSWGLRSLIGSRN